MKHLVLDGRNWILWYLRICCLWLFITKVWVWARVFSWHVHFPFNLLLFASSLLSFEVILSLYPIRQFPFLSFSSLFLFPLLLSSSFLLLSAQICLLPHSNLLNGGKQFLIIHQTDACSWEQMCTRLYFSRILSPLWSCLFSAWVNSCSWTGRRGQRTCHLFGALILENGPCFLFFRGSSPYHGYFWMRLLCYDGEKEFMKKEPKCEN